MMRVNQFNSSMFTQNTQNRNSRSNNMPSFAGVMSSVSGQQQPSQFMPQQSNTMQMPEMGRMSGISGMPNNFPPMMPGGNMPSEMPEMPSGEMPPDMPEAHSPLTAKSLLHFLMTQAVPNFLTVRLLPRCHRARHLRRCQAERCPRKLPASQTAICLSLRSAAWAA